MIKNIVLFTISVAFFLSNASRASHVVHCVLFGEYTQTEEESDDHYVFKFSVSSSMKIGGGYTDCQEYINLIRKVSLSKNAIPEGKSLNIGDKIFVEYYHLSDKGGIHANSYRYIGFHEKNH